MDPLPNICSFIVEIVEVWWSVVLVGLNTIVVCRLIVVFSEPEVADSSACSEAMKGPDIVVVC